jgi:hypothetical protein
MTERVVGLLLGNGITPVQMPTSGSGIPSLDRGLSVVQSSSKASGKRSIWEPASEGLFQPADHMREKRRRIDSAAGPRLPATGGPLDGKRTGLQTQPVPRTPLPPPQRVVNQQEPITRIVIRGAPGMQALDTVSKHALVFVHRSTRESKTLGASSTLPLTLGDGTDMRLNIAPVIALAPECFNYYMLHVQLNMFGADPTHADFYKLSAQDYMRDWSSDGVCIAEEMLNGAESALTGGYGRRGKWKGGDGFKVATDVIRGTAQMINVFGDWVTESAPLYLVVRKHKVPPGGFNFELDVRPLIPSSSAPGGSVLPDRNYMLARTAGRNAILAQELAEVANFMPFMGTLVCATDGDLPFAYRSYVDEWGVERPSAITMLGTVLHAPQDHTPRKLPADPAAGPQPLTSAREAVQRGLMTVLVNPRGFNPLV